MRLRTLQLAGCFILLAIRASASTFYVSLDSANPTSPYSDWSTAATNIQDAVDVAINGDRVVVTNGIYKTGGRLVQEIVSTTNRVLIDKPITVKSVNGPLNTIIEGYQVPGTTNGDAAIRCVLLTSNAVLSGFTLTNGATIGSFTAGGGAYCQPGSTLQDCIVINNAASGSGGGVEGFSVPLPFLTNCFISGNSGHDRAGVSGCLLINCTVTNNRSVSSGGGVGGCVATNSILIGNSARGGLGGGASSSTLVNCLVAKNFAFGGGGINFSTAVNCTIVGNSVSDSGGGALSSTLRNSILYFNSGVIGSNYYLNGSANYSCLSPLPSSGTGNIDTDPRLASISHLSTSSPCRGAGNITFASGIDLDGESWSTPPSIGCDEFYVGLVDGPLDVDIIKGTTNLVVTVATNFLGLVSGKVSRSTWDFGDGTIFFDQSACGISCLEHDRGLRRGILRV